MPFNPYLDNYGDGTWTDLEASDSEASEHDSQHNHNSQSSDSPSPRLHAQIIELCSEGSDAEEDALNAPDILPHKHRIVGRSEDVDKKDEEPANTDILQEQHRELFGDQEHVSLLNGFMKGPKNGDKLHGSPQAGQTELDPAENPNVDGNLGVTANFEAIDPECERCLRDHRRCDGVMPICGRCAVLRETKCQWPSVHLPRARFRMSDRLRRVPSSTIPSPRYAKSATRRGPVPGQTTGWSELAPSADGPGRLEPLSDLVQPDITSHNGSHHIKDLVFSDVLPKLTTRDDPNAQNGASPKPSRDMKYLDLSHSNPIPASPSPKKCRHCTTSGSKCDGKRPCQSCVKYNRHCYNNSSKPSVRRRGRPASALRISSNVRTTIEKKQSTSETSPVVSGSNESNRASTDLGDPATSRTASMISAHDLPGVRRARVKNADPKETGMVLCNGCAKGHLRCDAMLPCRRCERRGITCSYSDRYVASFGDASIALVDSGCSTTSSTPFAPLSRTLVESTSSNSETQSLTNIMSDDQVDGDIMHEEDPGGMIEVAMSDRPIPAVQAGMSKSPDGRWTSNSYKRKTSEPLSPFDISDFQQPQQKRARLGSEDGRWRPSGGARRNLRRSDGRPPTTRATSAAEHYSYTRLSPMLSTDATGGNDRDNDDTVPIRPEQVPSAIREVFASMRQDVLLDFTSEVSGPGRKQLTGLEFPQEQPDEYPTNEIAVRTREKRAEMPVLETLLKLRERGDVTELRRVMRMTISNPLTRWHQMSEAEQAELKEQKQQELAEHRDKCGRSANAFSNRILKLATSCVGEAAMLQFLMQSRKARLRVMSLFEGLVDLEEDGNLRLLAGGRGFESDDEETSSTISYEGEGENANEFGDEAAAFTCKWQACGTSFDSAVTLYEHLCEDHVGRRAQGTFQPFCLWQRCRFRTKHRRDRLIRHMKVHSRR
ncbi:hypothetical protein, variant [Phialophora macrospora]|uniref:pH-response transcription factor pacC/RIM101 n=1 Tax=Phialophora macrospora TaxID=1851006 RepID=A0A0D2GDW5_9EURO|nr:hypothetical protein, variant [Phialophora macrospora]